jgi:hypothetical protein
MKTFIMIFLLTTCISAYAQKLPNTQQVSLRAPANVKIDGKATEWGEKLQAYNPPTELFYTVANDDSNLYLVVQADKPRIIEKIIAVGITFTVNKNGIKDTKAADNVSVTFPLLDVATGYSIIRAAGIKTDNIPNNQLKASKITPTRHEADSLKTIANKLLKNASKAIKLTGLTGLPDTASIYNEHNMLTGVDYNKSGTYTYELQVPLKLLEISTKQAKSFSYNIKLRSRLEDKKPGTLIVSKWDKDGNTINPNQDLDATTDFWGEYTLAK